MDGNDLASFDVPMLAHELDILWGELPRREMSWFEIKELVDASIAYKGHLTRKCSRAKLVGPMPTEADLKMVHTYLVRPLRGNVHLLARSTQEYLAEACMQSFDTDPLLTALLAELAPETQDALRERLIDRLRTESNPRKYVWLTYVLFTDWRVP